MMILSLVLFILAFLAAGASNFMIKHFNVIPEDLKANFIAWASLVQGIFIGLLVSSVIAFVWALILL